MRKMAFPLWRPGDILARIRRTEMFAVTICLKILYIREIMNRKE